MTAEVRYRLGIPEPLRNDAASLYDEAFEAKFSIAVPNKEQRLPLLAESRVLPFSVAAIANGTLVGLAGFHTREGSFTDGMTTRKLFQQLGLWGGLKAAMVFSLYQRQQHESELLMDGIAVSQAMRGKGIGTELLEKLKQYARENGYSRIRLDVIDTNPAARRLYERQGFVTTRIQGNISIFCREVTKAIATRKRKNPFARLQAGRQGL